MYVRWASDTSLLAASFQTPVQTVLVYSQSCSGRKHFLPLYCISCPLPSFFWLWTLLNESSGTPPLPWVSGLQPPSVLCCGWRNVEWPPLSCPQWQTSTWKNTGIGNGHSVCEENETLSDCHVNPSFVRQIKKIIPWKREPSPMICWIYKVRYLCRRHNMYEISRNHKELDALDAVVWILCQLFPRSAFVLYLISQQTIDGQDFNTKAGWRVGH